MKKWILLITIGISMCSCLSHKKMLESNEHTMAQFSAESLNGTYKNSKKLWFNLERAYRLNRNEKNIVPDSTYVTLKFLSGKRLQVTLQTEKDVIDSFVLKGRMRDNYFSPRNKFSFFTLPPIIFYIREQYKILLGNNEQGDLTLTVGDLTEAIILPFGAGTKSNYSVTHHKIQTP